MKKIKYIFVTPSLLLPVTAFAAFAGIKGLLTEFLKLINSVIPILFGLSILYFFWGIIMFIKNDAGNDKTREEGKKKILWGIVAIFVFVSIYGILEWIGNTLGIDPGAVPPKIFTLPR